MEGRDKIKETAALFARAIKGRWLLPWSRLEGGGFKGGWTFYEHGTQKRIVQVHLAHKSSDEAQVLADYLWSLIHAAPALLASARREERLREALEKQLGRCRCCAGMGTIPKNWPLIGVTDCPECSGNRTTLSYTGEEEGK